MKKLFLLLAGGMVALGANAQYAKHNTDATVASHKTTSSAKAPHAPVSHPGARTTSACTYTESFGTGTSSSLPTGWTAGVISGTGTWHWDNVASTSAYTLGVLNSTTASDGWMIFDSDSIGTACSCAPAGWLQSPVYNCTSLSTVRLTFQELYRSFNDSCSVWVSTSPTFSTYTDFPVSLNDALSANTSTANPATVHINITSAAANQATVYIRFVYYGASGGSYSWLIDDLCLSTLDPHDVAISGSFMYQPDATAYNGSIFSTPLNMLDSIYPITQLSNEGANAETNVAVAAQIFQGTTSVYNHTITYASLPLNALDSLIQGYPGYKPNAVGNYFTAFSTTVTGDADPTNNIDTVAYSVTDTTWIDNSGNLSGGLYCHRASPALSYMNGTRFDVPSNVTADTVTGFGVVFDATSVPTTGSAKVSVQLYSVQQASTSWTYVGTSVARAITSADISTSSAITWAYFAIDQAASGGITPFILQPGTSYAAMIQINGVTTDLIVDVTPASSATGFAGYFGQGDTSSNDGATSFGSTAGIATGNTSDVPLVAMYLGHVAPLAVTNVELANTIGKAYPNPSNTSVNVPFTMGNDAVVTITLSNILGQEVKSQQINAVGGRAMTATFTTSDLTAGVYMYTVEVNGQHTTGRVVVAH